MIAIVHPSTISGRVKAPRSKSDMQRACAAALLHKGTTTINDPGRSKDDIAALDVISKLGATINDHHEFIIVNSKGVLPKQHTINCGESGLGIRMFTPIAALSSDSLTITGVGSLVNRPMNFFNETFPQLGISISSNYGKLPLRIKGPLIPASIEVDGSLSSQFLTGLLMSYSAANSKQVEIRVNDLTSRPYIDMTLRVMEAFGMKSPKVKNYSSFYFDTKEHVSSTGNISYTIEGDWSGAAFMLVAGAITGNVEVGGLKSASLQADKKIMEVLQLAGAKIDWEGEIIRVKTGNLKAFYFDASECPDLFPPLVALAAFCEGKTMIQGASRLKHKESDRAFTLINEFSKLGLVISQEGDCLVIQGVEKITGAMVDAHGDHRIAMALATAGLRSTDTLLIRNAESVAKSYPDFFDDLVKLSASVSLTSEN